MNQLPVKRDLLDCCFGFRIFIGLFGLLVYWVAAL